MNYFKNSTGNSRITPTCLLGIFILVFLVSSATDVQAKSFFKKNNTWDMKIPPNPELYSNSANMINYMIQNNWDRISWGSCAPDAQQSTAAPIYYADETTPTYEVFRFEGTGAPENGTSFTSNDSNIGVRAIADNGWNLNVPIPAGAKPPGYGATTYRDNHVIIVRKATNEVWEFFRAQYNDTLGRIDRAKRIKKWDLDLDGISQPSTGGLTNLAGVPYLHGLVRWEEIAVNKYIDHAILFVYPSSRKDGEYPAYPVFEDDPDPYALETGMRLQLDPSLDINTIPNCNEPCKIVAKALQEYGMINVGDNGYITMALVRESLRFDPERSWCGYTPTIQEALEPYFSYFRVIKPLIPQENEPVDYQSTSRNAVNYPKITPTSGTYQNSVTVTLRTTTSGSTIRYTLDGSTPTATNGIVYTGPFQLKTSATVKARAFKTGYNDSWVNKETYTITTGIGTSAPSPPIGLVVR